MSVEQRVDAANQLLVAFFLDFDFDFDRFIFVVFITVVEALEVDCRCLGFFLGCWCCEQGFGWHIISIIINGHFDVNSRQTVFVIDLVWSILHSIQKYN